MQVQFLLRTLFLSFFFGTFLVFANAQELRNNEDGEKIIVWPDGSWQYFSDFGSDDDSTFHTDGKQENSKKTYPIYDGTVDALEGYVSVTEEDILKIAVRKSQLANEAAVIAGERARQAVDMRQRIEKELAKALEVNTDDENIRRIKVRLEAAKRTESSTYLEAQEAQSGASHAKGLTEKGIYVDAFLKMQNDKKMQSQISSERREISGINYQSLLPLTDGFDGLSKDNDLILNPPAAPCNIVYDGKDDRTGRSRRDVRQQLLFTYTDDRLRPYLKEKEYLRCEGYLSAIGGGFRYLTLVFTFAYPNAREAYGFIEKGSILTIKQLNGNYVNLFSGKMDRGAYNTKTETLTYRVHYPIDRGQLSLLKTGEVDAIRVFWSSGYEEYEVFQLDFFRTQMDCLEGRR